MTLGSLANFIRSAFGDFLSVVEHSNALADAHDDLHVVLNEKNGEAKFFLRESDKLHELDFFRRIHSGGGFIEQKKLWPGGERAHDLETSLVAVRQRAAGKVALGGQAEDFQEFDDAGLDFAFLAGEPARA